MNFHECFLSSLPHSRLQLAFLSITNPPSAHLHAADIGIMAPSIVVASLMLIASISFCAAVPLSSSIVQTAAADPDLSTLGG